MINQTKDKSKYYRLKGVDSNGIFSFCPSSSTVHTALCSKRLILAYGLQHLGFCVLWLAIRFGPKQEENCGVTNYPGLSKTDGVLGI